MPAKDRPSEVLRSRITDSPNYFFQRYLNLKTWAKMEEIAVSVRDNRRTAVSGCTASSKTFTASAIVPWWLYSHGNPSRVITFAPTGRQVEMNMWGYIPTHIGNAPIPLGGELLTTSWKLAPDWYATGFSSDNPDNVKGIHAPNDLLIFDDAQGIHLEMFRSLELVMAGGSAHVLLLFNKDNISGEVYDVCHKKRHLYNIISISAYDTPNVKEGKVVIEGMITKAQVDEWEQTMDEDFIRVFVKDEFPKQQDNVLIPLEWTELAIKREVADTDKKIIAGLDVARMGKDSSVLALMRGLHTFPLETCKKYDTMELVGFARGFLDKLGASHLSVDEIGIGAGVLDRFRELCYNVSGVNVSLGQKEIEDVVQSFSSMEFYSEVSKYKFFNLRALVWWLLRMALDPKNPEAISLPNDALLVEELSSVRYKIDSDKVIRIEGKDITKVRLKRSPDNADAVCLANYGRLTFRSLSNQSLITVMG